MEEIDNTVLGYCKYNSKYVTRVYCYICSADNQPFGKCRHLTKQTVWRNIKMKNDINNDRYYICCSCGDPTHLLCFEYSDFETGQYLDIYFTANWKQIWYKRIWYALKFIFQRHPMCWSPGIIVDTINIHELEEVIVFLKEKISL